MNLMKQTTIKTYSTSDDQTFQSKSDAVAHEIGLKTNDGLLSGVGAELGTLLTGDDRAAVRDQLETLLKLSNMLDHKPRTGGKRKSSTTEPTEPTGTVAKGKRKAAEAATA